MRNAGYSQNCPRPSFDTDGFIHSLRVRSTESSVGGRGGGGLAVVLGVLVAVELVRLHLLLGRLREQVRHGDLLPRHVGDALQKKQY